MIPLPPWVYFAGAGATLTIGMAIGVTGTRMFYKAGMVDSLKTQIETLEKVDEAKNGLLDKAGELNAQTKATMETLTGALVDMSTRQPKHTERITERMNDAPQRYADLDPNECLSFKYPDGMRNEIRQAIRTHLAGLPQFDSSGQRVIYPTAGERPPERP